jgi:predicted transcriptional regulator
MARARSEFPTELELDILNILWSKGPLPVRDVRAHLASAPRGRELAHTSVITMLNIMVKKRYVRRKKQGKAFIFEPRVSKEEVSQGMLLDLVDRVFDGSAAAAMLGLLDSADLDRKDLRELRQLINRATKES